MLATLDAAARPNYFRLIHGTWNEYENHHNHQQQAEVFLLCIFGGMRVETHQTMYGAKT